MILNFLDFLSEKLTDSPFAPVYHTTDLSSSINIFTDNALGIEDPQHGKVTTSVTRLKDFIYGGMMTTLELDQTKLRSKFKFRPFDYFSKGAPKPKRDQSGNEAEEVISGKITDLNKYLINIRLNGSGVMMAKKYITSNYAIPQDKKGQILSIKTMYDYASKYKIPIIGNGKPPDEWKGMWKDHEISKAELFNFLELK